METSIVVKNAAQTISEVDTFTIERYKQFSRYCKPHNTILDIGCNTGRGGGELKKIIPGVKLYGIEFIKERILKIPNGVYEKVWEKSIPVFYLTGLLQAK